MENQPKSTASTIVAIISQALFNAFLVLLNFIIFFVAHRASGPSTATIVIINIIIGTSFILLTIILPAALIYHIFSGIKKRKTYIICYYIYAFAWVLFGSYMFYLVSQATGFLAGLAEALIGLFFFAVAISTALSLTIAIITFYLKNKASKRISRDNSIT